MIKNYKIYHNPKKFRGYLILRKLGEETNEKDLEECIVKNLNLIEPNMFKSLDRVIESISKDKNQFRTLNILCCLINNVDIDAFKIDWFRNEFCYLFNRYGVNKSKKLMYKIRSIDTNELHFYRSSNIYFISKNTTIGFINHILDEYKIRQENEKLELVTLHEILINLPKGINRKYLDEDGNANMLFEREGKKFISNIMRRITNKNKLLKYIQFLNYSKVRQLKLDDNNIEAYMEIVLKSRNGVNYRSSYDYKNEYINRVENNSRFKISKDDEDIYTIGSKTLCCFRPNNLAAPLLNACRDSSTSYLTIGEIRENRQTFFTYNWEIVEEVEINGDKFLATSLILDNLEATSLISKEIFDSFIDWLSNSKYYRIYLGTSRNDIEGSKVSEIMGKTFNITSNNSIKKPFNPPFFESNFRKYGSYDDSRYLYIVYEDDKYFDDITKDKIIKYIDNPREIERSSFIKNYSKIKDDKVIDYNKLLSKENIGIIQYRGRLIEGIKIFDDLNELIIEYGKIDNLISLSTGNFEMETLGYNLKTNNTIIKKD